MNGNESWSMQVLRLGASASNAISRFGAEVMVQTQFIDAVLQQLSPTQCEEAARLFRQGIERILSYTDDVVMPAEYNATLLKRTNILLNALDEQSESRR